jgi:hypothetical protein
MAVCSHLNFSSNFGGFSRRFFIRTALFYLNPKRPHTRVRTLIIEKMCENLSRMTPCSSETKTKTKTNANAM